MAHAIHLVDYAERFGLSKLVDAKLGQIEAAIRKGGAHGR
jgi:hypothetical protein